MSQDRIIALEEKVAFLEHDLEELDGVVRTLHDHIDALNKSIERLRADLEASRGEDDSDLNALPEVPPSHRFPSERNERRPELD